MFTKINHFSSIHKHLIKFQLDLNKNVNSEIIRVFERKEVRQSATRGFIFKQQAS